MHAFNRLLGQLEKMAVVDWGVTEICNFVLPFIIFFILNPPYHYSINGDFQCDGFLTVLCRGHGQGFHNVLKYASTTGEVDSCYK